MKDATAAPGKPAASAGDVALAMIATAIFMFGAYLVSIHLFFGTAIGEAIMLTAPFAVAVFFPIIAANTDTGNAVLAAIFTALACFVAMEVSPSAQASRAAADANMKIQEASGLLGHAPAIATQVKAMTASAATVQENLDFIRQVGDATVSRQEVTSHLIAAGQLGVDASFVATNAMVRPLDRDDLFQRALDQAAAGNRDALAFLQDNQLPSH